MGITGGPRTLRRRATEGMGMGGGLFITGMEIGDRAIKWLFTGDLVCLGEL